MTCVLLAPTLGCMVWMTVFGGSAIALNANYPQIGLAEVPLQLFVMLEQLPLTELTTIVSIFLSIVFFVTSSDSGSMVIDSLASNGNLKTPVPQRIFWCGLGGAVAAALVLGGGLVALQAMAISTGLPFAVVLLLGGAATIYNLIKIHSANKQSTDWERIQRHRLRGRRGHELCEMVYRFHDRHIDDCQLYALDGITLFGSALRHDTKHAQV